jgi:uncharacterized membrane protein
MPALRTAFIAASIAWPLALPLAPYLVSRAHASAYGTAVVLGIYSVGSLICHQRPERSFHLWGAQLPVCARCTGIYAGAALACLVLASGRAYAQSTARDASAHGGERSRRSDARLILGAAVLPSALTLAYEWVTGEVPSNAMRTAAGMPIGIAVSWLVIHATHGGWDAGNQVN